MSNIIPFKFDHLEIRAITSESGEPLLIAADVAAALDYSEASAMTRHLDADERGSVKLTDRGQEQDFIVINESGLYSAILKSRKPEAKRFKKWVTSEVLPAIRKTGSYTAPQAQPVAAIEQDLRVVGILADLLRVAPSGRIAMAQVVLEQSAPHLLPALPGYAVDAPPSAIVSGSSLPTASATDLLKRHGLTISAMKFNERLSAYGMLEQQARTSRGNAKHYWSVTEKGSEFGKNITSNQNARETQPHWYVERFPDLLRTCFAS